MLEEEEEEEDNIPPCTTISSRNRGCFPYFLTKECIKCSATRAGFCLINSD
jgi:hypothetical protein